MNAFARQALAGACLLALLASPAAAEEYRLEPKAGGSWVADFGEDRCRLARLFGDEEEPTLLIFDQVEPSSRVFLTVAGGPVSRLTRGSEVNVRFGPAWDESVELGFRKAEFEGYGSALFLGIPTNEPEPEPEPEEAAEDEEEQTASSRFDVEGLHSIDVEAARSFEWLELSNRRNSVVLQLPNVAEAFDVLNQCSQDLVAYWGLDLDAHRTMIRQPEPINLAEITRHVASQYPRAALRRGEQATLGLRIVVDADGSIKECVITDITATQTLVSPACDVFGDRAMFVPGEDAEGEPMRSYYSTHIIYTIGGQ